MITVTALCPVFFAAVPAQQLPAEAGVAGVCSSTPATAAGSGWCKKIYWRR